MARTADHELVHHGSAHPAKASTEVQLADDDPRIWGWHHKGTGKASRIAGIVVALVLFAMLWATHEGRVEVLGLPPLAAIWSVTLLAGPATRRKSAWRK